ncbi:MAG: type II secretion system protein [Candidatus Nomurabacteria bacterium]|nr:MAG: type II secretion system protein [Candidatus Nomurabacteria bacterium]
MYKKNTKAFTLIELLVVIAIIGLLSAILFAAFDDARKQARDKTRLSELKELQLAIQLYKAQNDRYPEQGCGTPGTSFAGPSGGTDSGDKVACGPSVKYILGLTPDFTATLPTDPKSENEPNKGFYYMTNAAGTAYKLMVYDTVESLAVSSYGDEFARCPRQGGACPTATPADANSRTYAVYSIGAEDW